MKKIIALITALMVVLAMSFAAPSMVNAAPECTEVVTIVDSPASSEVVHHPAVTHTETVTVTDSEAFDEKVIDSPAVEAVIGQWWNWSPNNTQGPQDYTPLFPVDVRGTWQGPHTEGGPEGEGTFNVSHGESGNSSWFHRVLAVEGSPEVSHIVHHDAVTHEESTEVVDSPAFNTTTNHPAVTHDETKAVDCGDSGTPDSPDNPNSTDEPKTVIKVTPVEPKAKVQKSVQVPTEIESGL